MSQLQEWKDCRIVGGRSCVPVTAPSLPALSSVRTHHKAGDTENSVGAVSKPTNFVVIIFPVKGMS